MELVKITIHQGIFAFTSHLTSLSLNLTWAAFDFLQQLDWKRLLLNIKRSCHFESKEIGLEISPVENLYLWKELKVNVRDQKPQNTGELILCHVQICSRLRTF